MRLSSPTPAQEFTAAHDACRAVGASVEGNHGARDEAAQAAIGFLKKTYAN